MPSSRFGRQTTRPGLFSLDALREASGTSHYQGDDALWAKVVVENTGSGAGGGRGGFGGFGGGTGVQVSR